MIRLICGSVCFRFSSDFTTLSPFFFLSISLAKETDYFALMHMILKLFSVRPSKYVDKFSSILNRRKRINSVCCCMEKDFVIKQKAL